MRENYFFRKQLSILNYHFLKFDQEFNLKIALNTSKFKSWRVGKYYNNLVELKEDLYVTFPKGIVAL